MNNDIPQDAQDRLTNALNNVTIAEAEYARLTKLSFTENENIKKLHTEKKELEAQILGHKSNIEAYVSESNEKRDIHSDLSSRVQESQEELVVLNAQIEKATEILTQTKQDTAKRTDEIASLESGIAERHSELLKREEAHQAKVEKLRIALE